MPSKLLPVSSSPHRPPPSQESPPGGGRRRPQRSAEHSRAQQADHPAHPSDTIGTSVTTTTSDWGNATPSSPSCSRHLRPPLRCAPLLSARAVLPSPPLLPPLSSPSSPPPPMSGRFVRASSYRHVHGKTPKPDQEYSELKPQCTGEGNFIAANEKFDHLQPLSPTRASLPHPPLTSPSLLFLGGLSSGSSATAALAAAGRCTSSP